jgi:hypothetical protein
VHFGTCDIYQIYSSVSLPRELTDEIQLSGTPKEEREDSQGAGSLWSSSLRAAYSGGSAFRARFPVALRVVSPAVRRRLFSLESIVEDRIQLYVGLMIVFLEGNMTGHRACPIDDWGWLSLFVWIEAAPTVESVHCKAHCEVGIARKMLATYVVVRDEGRLPEIGGARVKGFTHGSLIITRLVPRDLSHVNSSAPKSTVS